ATEELRAEQRTTRAGKLDEDPQAVAERFRAGELDTLDLVRHYGVILDWGTAELLPRTTEQYRDMLKRRAAACWSVPPQPAG
ncbi:MAG: hydantoinase B/oxoprolinase family protein, partial [Solirubrobacterales bacterium]|nr:hydantoinase B/oxoprolinase family protein [Solirubrobacterales bacterium]